MSFSVLSWNILGPATRDVADYGFIPGDYGRLGKHLEIINQFQADILCFQEVDLTTLHFFNNFLFSQYLQAAYHEKGTHGGIVIYVRKSKFELIESIGSVLQSSPKEALGAFCGSIVKNIADNSELFIASVHLSKSSHPQAISRAEYQIADLCAHLGKSLPSKTIFTGDFNTMYEDMKDVVIPAMSKIVDKEFLMFEHETCTATSLTGEFKSIDHILYTDLKINMEKSCVFSGKYEHINPEYLQAKSTLDRTEIIPTELPSDHAPLFVMFE